MSFDPLTTAETAAKKAIRQALMRKILANFDDHELRVAGVEGLTASSINDHFDNTDNAIAAAPSIDNDRWAEAVSGAVIAMATTEHAITLTAGAVNQRARIRARIRNFPPLLPSLKARLKYNDRNDVAELAVGMADDRAIGTAQDDGVYLIIDATNAFFRAIKNGTSSDGPTFARPANGTYFEVEIKWAAIDTIACTLNGGELKTFISTDNIPDTFSETLFGEVHLTSAPSVGTVIVTIDRIESRNTSIADSA